MKMAAGGNGNEDGDGEGDDADRGCDDGEDDDAATPLKMNAHAPITFSSCCPAAVATRRAALAKGSC